MSDSAIFEGGQRQKNHHGVCPGLYRIIQAADGGLCRIKLEQGRISSQQWRALAAIAQNEGNGIIEITTRANIQLRGVRPNRAAALSTLLEQAGFAPKIPQGDDVRNVMVNPTAGFDKQGDVRIVNLAQHISVILQTTPRYQTLSPKFSLLLDGGEQCAILHHHNDIWLSLCDGGKNFAFGLASRPPLEGEENSREALGKVPFHKAQSLIFTLIDCLLEARATSIDIQRMKQLLQSFGEQYVVDFLHKKQLPIQPFPAFRRQVDADFSYLGLHETAMNERFYLAVKAPLGRLTPALCHLIADCAETNLLKQTTRLTPWQGIIFPDCHFDQAQKLAQILQQAGFVTQPQQPLARMICCAGLAACRSAKADVRTHAKHLARTLMGQNFRPIHLSACDKSCAANEAAPATLVALDGSHYDLFIADPRAISRFGRKQASNITIDEAAKFLLQ